MNESTYMNGDDVAGTADHWQTLVHEQLPHMFDIPLVGPAEPLALVALQDTDGLQGSRQDHWRQGSGEDEAGGKGAHRVHEGSAAGDVASNTAECFAWTSNRCQRVCEVSGRIRVGEDFTRIQHCFLLHPSLA